MRKWEYCCQQIDFVNTDEKLSEILNSYSQDSWELIEIWRGVAIFKRPSVERLSKAASSQKKRTLEK